MLDIRSFDELNNIVGLNRSEDFDTYFDVMDIPEEEKKNRISLAEDLMDDFLVVLALLFSMQQYEQPIDWVVIQIRFESAYRNALAGRIDMDDDLDNYIRQFSSDVTESSRNHMDDPYYYSLDRARYMAENESNTSWNHSDFANAIKQGKTRKKWVDVRDNRERETHRRVGGTIIKIQEPFLVGDSLMYFPKDCTFSPSIKEVINCRCSIRYY